MKRNFLYLSMLLILPLMFLGCAQNIGDNPDSETGGGDNGYGVFSPSMTNGDGNLQDLIGTWRHNSPQNDFETVQFNDDGTFEIRYYVDGVFDSEDHGTYTASESQLFVEFTGGPSYVISYTLSGDILIVDWNDGTLEYFRIN
jgi:hypothetical protein